MRTPNSRTELGIIDLLKVFGFNRRLKTKIVRHQSSTDDMQELVANGWFETYQQIQTKPIFKKCEQIVILVGDGPGRGRFIGVYRVLSQSEKLPIILPQNCPYPLWADKPKYQYALEKCAEFADLEGRVVVDWGAGALSFHQHLRNKPVIELFSKGRTLRQFTDYLDFSLSYQELVSLFENEHAHKDWAASLKAVSGIYLILAEQSGRQYVGSACGLEGIWGRWKSYAANGHGGNEGLKGLLADEHILYPQGFRFSILQVLPKTTLLEEVLRWEAINKGKLGSKVMGLNLN